MPRRKKRQDFEVEEQMLVEVTWLDPGHSDVDEEVPKEDIESFLPAVMITRGKLILDTGDRIVVAGTTCEDSYRDVLVIPRCLVKNLIELKEAK